MERFSLFDGAVIVAPKRLPRLDEYFRIYPAPEARYDLPGLARIFFPRLSRECKTASRDLFALSEEALKWLFALLPAEPSAPRLAALRALPSCPKKKKAPALFRGKNVVFVGYVPVTGRVFAALLQDVPNLSSSWALPRFGVGLGLGNLALEELYRVLDEKEIAELCLPRFEEYLAGKAEERLLALSNGREMK